MRLPVAVLAVAALGLGSAASAHGDDRLYFTSSGDGAVRVVDPGGGPVTDLFPHQRGATGVDVDVARARLVVSRPGGVVATSGLDGGGNSIALAEWQFSTIDSGIAIDASRDRVIIAQLYFGNFGEAPLSGGPRTPFATVPGGSNAVAVDATGGRVYLASSQGLFSTDLDGAGTPALVAAGWVTGVAVDRARGRLFWTSSSTGDVSSMPLDGSAPSTVLYSGQGRPYGVAYDPASDELFWISRDIAAVRRAPADGSGPVTDVATGQNEPRYLSLLREPVSSAPPDLTGAPVEGQTLACSTGSWVPDSPEAFVHRPPGTFSYAWERDGMPIPGATGATYVPTLAGSHRCRVTSTNLAGATAAASATVQVLPAPPAPTSPPAAPLAAAGAPSSCPPGNSAGVTCAPLPGGGLYIVGTTGDDRIVGSAANDTIAGLTGDDVISGGPGDDLIGGSDGHDLIGGNQGDDTIYGDAGDDRLRGDAGNDTLGGGAGEDDLEGGAGDDDLRGDEDDDDLWGGDGKDRLSGQEGDDRASGQGGDDLVFGSEGADRLFGGQGDDHLSGGPGADHLSGGPDDDRLRPGADRDDDEVICGPGRDVILPRHADRLDRDCAKARRR